MFVCMQIYYRWLSGINFPNLANSNLKDIYTGHMFLALATIPNTNK